MPNLSITLAPGEAVSLTAKTGCTIKITGTAIIATSKPMPTCTVCGGHFKATGARGTATTCSGKCRQRLYRSRKQRSNVVPVTEASPSVTTSDR
jgi:hypothetical protein